MPPQDTTTTVIEGNNPPGQIDSIAQEFITHQQQALAEQRDRDSSDKAQNIFIVFVIIMVILITWLRRKRKEEDEQEAEEGLKEEVINSLASSQPQVNQPLIYKGKELSFTNEILTEVLEKHFPYFIKLTRQQKEKFLSRLQAFIREKIFVINDDKGFREMPILTGASAIQLTFGLENYLLPGFIYINIYPAEFICTVPSIRYLEGNVSGNTINIGWKYLLEGLEDYSDGQNLGVHEMSHAFYYQAMVLKDGVDVGIQEDFKKVDAAGLLVYDSESNKPQKFFSEYALKNTQEFWAESIELFFERPLQLKVYYPAYYNSICELLKQDPASFPF